jgi:hypothetical protein
LARPVLVRALQNCLTALRPFKSDYLSEVQLLRLQCGWRRKLPLTTESQPFPDGIFVAPFEQGEIGPDLFHKACEFGLEDLASKLRESVFIAAAPRAIESRSRTGHTRRWRGS